MFEDSKKPLVGYEISALIILQNLQEKTCAAVFF